MTKALLTDKIKWFLEKKEFINTGTCNFSGRPNVAPKFLVKLENNIIYLADSVFGRTFNNLKINHHVSLSMVDMDSLIGYQINGVCEVIERGVEYKKILKEMKTKQINFSVTRLIEGLHKEKKYKDFEVTLSEKVCIFKIKIEEIVSIGVTGKLERTKI
ncbi:MAG: pyridoxamine 5'-phosphate oxidase family protein [Candidatus Omnitrophota bacterium]|jgi:predicted pyridoxine 5'-phosphate oxidase superfamily flavin-nucleotide-binding protein